MIGKSARIRWCIALAHFISAFLITEPGIGKGTIRGECLSRDGNRSKCSPLARKKAKHRSQMWSSFPPEQAYLARKVTRTYTATKGALDAFMKSLAMDLAPTGRANSVLPGMIEGGMADFSRQDPSYPDTIKANYPLGLGRAADVAAAVEFLLSTTRDG